MIEYNLLITEEQRWLPENALRDALLDRFPGTQIAYGLVPRSAFNMFAFIPDPLPGDDRHTLEASLIDTGNCLSLEEASLEKAAEIVVWVLATFPVPPGADVMLWYLDDAMTIDPTTVTEADIIARFQY